MKISKLFHWLYAVLMLLPVAFIAVRCGYVMFNKNAKDSYYGEIINQQETTQVTNNKLLPNHLYTTFFNESLNFKADTPYYSDFVGITYVVETTIPLLNGIEDNIFGWDFYVSGTDFNIRVYYNDNGTTNYKYFTYASETGHSNKLITYYVNQENTISNNYQSCTTYITYNKYSYLDNAFEYSVNQLNEVPLFSWAKDSFLVVPFSYITGLFGLASTNPINTLLSYWLSISIIWLVFDLVMYLPLLIHRWLDKGVLE